MMSLPILSALCAFLLTLFLIEVLQEIAHTIGLVDNPGGRKQHAEPVPLIGGLAMFLGFSFAVFTLNQSIEDYQGLWAGATLLVLVGLMDDRYELSTRSRFTAQTLAAVLMVSYGQVYLVNLGDLWGTGDILLGHWAIPFTLFGVIGVINAINMADGLDGLAGGLILIASGWLAVVALLSEVHSHSALFLLLLAAAIAGFLCYNLRHPWRRRAAIFMGDAGSMMLGFILVWFLIVLSQGERPAMTPVTALWILALPLLDTVRIMARRLFKGRNPFYADREHLHHTLLLAGFSDAKTVAIILTAAAVFGGIGVMGWLWAVPEYIMFYSFMVLFALYFAAMSYTWKLLNAFMHLHAVQTH